MSHTLLGSPRLDASTRLASQPSLTTLTDKMAELRYLILITARWEGSDSVGRAKRTVMRNDLVRLRKEYANRIDEIAMNYGVQQAMDAQRDVERRVQLPAHVAPSSRPECSWDEAENDPHI